MEFLVNADDIMAIALDVDPQGIELWKQIKRDGGLSYFVQLSNGDSAQSSQMAAEYAVLSERILETVNSFFLCFESLEDVMDTLHTHNVTGGLDSLSARCNKTRLAICPFTSKFQKETRFLSTSFPLRNIQLEKCGKN